ncbi:sensor histidine kinase [Umezawaea sp. Da 62-37]|uniref:sensor histidine kinase n=1 Tax=Umezawaea sp. Da 62-37 TaxID=3075927 RepID=UPI0028F6E636|nr:sensor histidine kinase [Umezawaea sp. Da 62-37]WNV85899.1 sensor histidine kinase [Umezawaea sp. Da 62-37]
MSTTSGAGEADALWSHPLFDRASRLWQRFQRQDAARPWLTDLGLVVAVALLFCVPDLIPCGCSSDYADHTVLPTVNHLPWQGTVALQAGLVVPLFWRRRRPVLVLGVVIAVFLVQWSQGAWLRADVAVLIALCGMALHGAPRRLPAAVVATLVVLTLMILRIRNDVSFLDAFFYILTNVIAAVSVGLVPRIRRAQLAGLRERAARLEVERDQRSRLAAATERTRVAREMHDIVGHHVSVMITLADGGGYAAALSPDRGRQALLLIGDTGRQALRELRRSLGVLREHTDPAPHPGTVDLDDLCARVRAAGPHVVRHTEGDLATLDRSVQLAVYRIAQESLTNALKHAGPDTSITLAVTVEDTRVSIEVTDTGSGGRPTAAHGEGHGLTGMRERAALYNGTFSAGPSPRGGWAVRATFALTAPRANAGAA